MRDALVIIDMQKGFVNEYTNHLPKAIFDFAKNGCFSEIIGFRYVNHEKTPCYIFEGWSKCMEGSEESELAPGISYICNAIFKKDVYSGWNDQLKKYLSKKGIDRVVFVGVNTGCCVLHSAFDAYNDLFETIVVSDLCGSTSGQKSHEAALQILSECITKERVITSEEYLEMVKESSPYLE